MRPLPLAAFALLLSGAAGAVQLPFSCRFKGMEAAYAKTPEIALRLMAGPDGDAVNGRVSTTQDPEGEEFSGLLKDDTARLDHARRALLDNYSRRDRDDSYDTAAAKSKMMAAEAPFYEALARARSMETASFGADNDYFEEIHFFFDENRALLGVYGHSRFTAFRNFCIP